jgi:hypothetical protein
MATSDETGRAQPSGPKQATQQPALDPAAQKVVELLVSILQEVKRQVTGQAPSTAVAPEVAAELRRIREALLGPPSGEKQGLTGQSQDNPTQASGT